MTEYACSKERFLDDIKDHELTIIKDDGLYRHIRMSRKDSFYYRYDLITTPYYLFVIGDMGEWIFSRIENMFEFFIMSENDYNKKNVINPHYWAEKLQASKNGCEEFSVDKINDMIKYYQEGWYERIEELVEEDLIQETKDELDEFISDTFGEILCYNEYEIYSLLNAFEFHINDNTVFRFEVWYDHNFKEYTFSYIWICYAIVYAITKYNEVKGES